MNKTLVITLQSDLCAAVGKHYAAMIDLDTALDECGLPFIPSKRLKGCLKDAAQLIGTDTGVCEALFGVSGSEEGGSLRIGEARIEDYKAVREQIQSRGIRPDEVISLYCSVRGQTAIDPESGTADDTSLRYIRVVNQYAPNKSKMRFLASVSFEDAYAEDVEKICNALRNIGYNRNRGLGAVSCDLEEAETAVSIDGYDKERGFEEDKTYEIAYTVKLEGDLMLPANDANHSLDFIPGTTALGAFAGKYIKRFGSFNNDLFLSGKVQFGNLYISDYDAAEKKVVCYTPTPLFIAKVKAAQEDEAPVVNTIRQEPDIRWKAVKKGFFHFDYGEKKVKEKIVYHNHLADKEDGGLYMQYCLCAGQYFSGTIAAPGKYAEQIYALLEDGELFFGRSKGAQYARCRICRVACSEQRSAEEKTVSLEPGSVVAFVLESDAILTDEHGANTVNVTAFMQAVAGKTGWKADAPLRDETAIGVRNISGYNAKWNLKKPHYAAIAAGSCLVLDVEERMEVEESFTIGQKKNEGFGKVRVMAQAELKQIGTTAFQAAKKDSQAEAFIAMIERRRLEEAVIAAAMTKAADIGKTFAPAQVGRLTLMCKESTNAEDFEARINSIKGDYKEKVLEKFGHARLIKDLQEAGITGVVSWSLIKTFILNTLTVVKYRLRKEKKQ